MHADLSDFRDVRRGAQSRLRHFLADFARLEEEYPASYPHIMVRGEGAYLYDDAGRRLLDAGTHLGSCQIGHGRREMAERIAEQVSTLEFSALDSGNSHIGAIRLAERLAGMVPMADACFSFCNSGSEANELAIKVARAYHAQRGEPQRTKILSRVGSYHGSSYAAMAATGIKAFGDGFGPLPGSFVPVPQPSPERCPFCSAETGCSLACVEETRRIVEAEGPGTIAAIIGEPVAITQAVKVPHPEYWPRLRRLCDEIGALLIHDEVVTGFGRIGRLFGAQHWNVVPDIMVMAKGITSGYVPMGAVGVSGRVNAVFRDKPLLHLNTFAGHPVACAAAEANLDILEREKLVENAARMEAVLRRELERISQSVPQIVKVSVIGLMSSTEVDASRVADLPRFVRKVRHLCYQESLLVRVNPDGQRVSAFFYPPLVVGEEDIVTGVRSLERAFRAAFADG